MIDLRARSAAERFTEPVGRALGRLGIRAWMVTAAGLLVTTGGAALVAGAHLLAGALVIGFGSAIDAFDGAVARARGSASRRGAFLDAFFDRLGEMALWAGLAYFAADDRQRLVLIVLALGNSLIISYLRSRAEGYGVVGKGGLMGRAERVIIFCVGVGLEGLGVPSLLPMLWVMAGLTGLTVLQRFRSTWVRLAE